MLMPVDSSPDRGRGPAGIRDQRSGHAQMLEARRSAGTAHGWRSPPRRSLLARSPASPSPADRTPSYTAWRSANEAKLVWLRTRMRMRFNRAWQRLRARPPRWTLRVRLAVLLFAVLLGSGTVLLFVTFVIFQGRAGDTLQAAPVGLRTHITPVSSDGHQLLI